MFSLVFTGIAVLSGSASTPPPSLCAHVPTLDYLSPHPPRALLISPRVIGPLMNDIAHLG